MCSCNYTYVGPALLVLPLFVISLINLFVAGPPLKTVVLDSNGASYGASLPFLQLQVQGGVAKFNLLPKDEMTQFVVVACYAPGTTTPLYFDATVMGKKPTDEGVIVSRTLAVQSTRPEKPLLKDASETHVLQVMQNFLGYSEYEVVIKSVQPDRSKAHGIAITLTLALALAVTLALTLTLTLTPTITPTITLALTLTPTPTPSLSLSLSLSLTPTLATESIASPAASRP
jgi:serine/threonine-protein kinase ATR